MQNFSVKQRATASGIEQDRRLLVPELIERLHLEGQRRAAANMLAPAASSFEASVASSGATTSGMPEVNTVWAAGGSSLMFHSAWPACRLAGPDAARP